MTELENKLEKELTNAFNKLDDSDKLQLWNDYCDKCNMLDDQVFPVDELEEIYPLSSFNDVQECIQMYSSICYDTGVFNCEYATLNGYGYLIPFNIDTDIDVDSIVDAIVIDGLLCDVLPDELQEVLNEVEEEAE